MLRQNGLSLLTAALFLALMAAQYLSSGHFVEATAENWESEFLQMAACVLLTAWLFQKGSSESKKPDEAEAVDRDPREARGKRLREAPIGLVDYVSSPRFWFESFQNWQSEFLALVAMVLLSIVLRERGSPESKPVDAPHSHTGSS